MSSTSTTGRRGPGDAKQFIWRRAACLSPRLSAWLLKNGRHGHHCSCTSKVLQTGRLSLSHRCSSPRHLGQCDHKTPRTLARCGRHHQLSLEYVQYPCPQPYSPPFKDLLASKSGVSPAKLRVVAQGVEYNFIFSGPEPANMTDRDAFKDKLKPLLRASMQAKTPSATPPLPSSPRALRPRTAPPRSPVRRKNNLRQRPNPLLVLLWRLRKMFRVRRRQPDAGLDPVKARLSAEYSARKELLKSNPELAALHAAVVLRGSVSEADFWAHRQVRIALIPCSGSLHVSYSSTHVPR
jgi:hypothetical protein